MLERFISSGYSYPDYQHVNDRLIYIDYINKKYKYGEVSITPIDAYRYQGNLFGLFIELGIEKSLHLYAMYLNGYVNPSDYDGIKCVFKLPKEVPIFNY